MDGYNSLKTSLMEFEKAIRNLSMGINNSVVLWRDAQYEQLYDKMSALASSSREVLQAGERCKVLMKEFEHIVEEI